MQFNNIEALKKNKKIILKQKNPNNIKIKGHIDRFYNHPSMTK